MRVKEKSEKVGLKFNIQKTKIMAFRPITSWQINGETVETVTDFIFSVQSIQFNCSVVSDSLQPHGLQHLRPPCPSPIPGVHPNPCPLSRWCHPTSVILCHLIPSSPSPPALNLSQHKGLFQWVGSSPQVAKVWSFSFSITPSNEYSGLISFRIDWFDILAVQGTLKSLFQHHSSKALILRHSAFFFMVQLSQLYVTTGKTIALTTQTFVSRVMSLLFNTLSRFVIAFLPRSNHLLVS